MSRITLLCVSIYTHQDTTALNPKPSTRRHLRPTERMADPILFGQSQSAAPIFVMIWARIVPFLSQYGAIPIERSPFPTSNASKIQYLKGPYAYVVHYFYQSQWCS